MGWEFKVNVDGGIVPCVQEPGCMFFIIIMLDGKPWVVVVLNYVDVKPTRLELKSFDMPFSKEITETFLRNPIKILVKKDLLTLQGIKQYYVVIMLLCNYVIMLVCYYISMLLHKYVIIYLCY